MTIVTQFRHFSSVEMIEFSMKTNEIFIERLETLFESSCLTLDPNEIKKKMFSANSKTSFVKFDNSKKNFDESFHHRNRTSRDKFDVIQAELSKIQRSI